MAKKPYLTKDQYADYFAYLDALRKSGVTNMFGARPYLEQEFDLPKAEATKVLTAWMQSFSRDKTAEERARMAQ